METFIQHCHVAAESSRAASQAALDQHIREVYHSVDYLDTIQEYSRSEGQGVNSELLCSMALSPLTDREGAGGETKGRRAARRARLHTPSSAAAAAVGDGSTTLDLSLGSANLNSEVCKHVSLYFDDLLTGDAVFRQPLPSLARRGDAGAPAAAVVATKDRWTAVALSVVLCWATNAPLFEQWLQQRSQPQRQQGLSPVGNLPNSSSPSTSIYLKSTPTRSRCQSQEQSVVASPLVDEANGAEKFFQELLATEVVDTERRGLMEEWCFLLLQGYWTDVSPAAWQSYLQLVRRTFSLAREGRAGHHEATPLACSAILLRGLLFLFTVAGGVGLGEKWADLALPRFSVRVDALTEKELLRLYQQLTAADNNGSSSSSNSNSNGSHNLTGQKRDAVVESVLLSDSFWLLNSTIEFPSMWSRFYSMLEMEGDSDMDV